MGMAFSIIVDLGKARWADTRQGALITDEASMNHQREGSSCHQQKVHLLGGIGELGAAVGGGRIGAALYWVEHGNFKRVSSKVSLRCPQKRYAHPHILNLHPSYLVRPDTTAFRMLLDGISTLHLKGYGVR